MKLPWELHNIEGGLLVGVNPLLGVECDCLFFLAALGLGCCVRTFSSCGERGLLFVVVHGLLVAVASLVAEHGL